MKALIALALLAVMAGCMATSEPASQGSVIGRWDTKGSEYQLTIARPDSAYLYEKFNDYGAPDSSFSMTQDSVFLLFWARGTRCSFRLKVYADSLAGSASFGTGASMQHECFVKVQ